MTQVEVQHPERDPTIGVEVELQIFGKIRRQYEPPSLDLAELLSGGTDTRRELRYHPPPSRMASAHGIGRFVS
jgi:hypothetical protein